MSRTTRTRAALAAALLLPAAGALPAQAPASSPAASQPARDGTVEGRVTTPAGVPLGDVMVLLQGAAGSTPRGAMTDEAGRFAVRGVPAGRYTLVARRVGLGEARRELEVGAAGVRADLTLVEQATVVAPVVVSATRETQRRAEASATIDVLDGAEVRLARAAHPAQVLKRVPGVYVSQLSGEGHSMAIRQPITTKPMYLYLEDGIPTRATGFFNHNALYEVNIPQSGGIEVLKGPGTALYGSDAIGGVVNVLTRPAPAAPSVEVATEGGGYGYGRVLASGGTTRGRDGVRADLNLTRMDGWRDRNAYDRQSATLRWDHFGNDGLTVRTTVTGTRVDQNDAIAQDSAQFARRDPLNRSPLAYRQVRAVRGATTVERQTERASWSVAPYVRYNQLDLLPNWQLTFDPQAWATTSTSYGLLAKARRDLPGLRAKLIAGADLDLTPGSYRADSLRLFRSGSGVALRYDSAQATRAVYDYDVTYRQASPYVQAEVAPTARLRIDAGARYDWMAYDYTTNLAPTQAGRWRVPENTSRTYTRLSPKVGVTYEASPALGVFASWRAGFRAPGQGQLFTQGTTANTVDLKPVKVASSEVGLRGQLGRRVLYQASAYDMTIRDDILTFTRPDGLREARNAGTTRHRGVEASAGAMLLPTLKLDLSWSVSAQRYVTYAPTPAISYAGLDVEQAPTQLGNALLSWSPRALRGGRLAAEWSHTGSYVAGYFLDAQSRPTAPKAYGGHDVLHLHANAQLTRHVELFGRVLNLTDRTYAELAGFTFNDRVQPDQFTPGAPRTVYAGLRYAWAK
ncbi:TonB-dependent receptor [Roseisolibacter sp. H3M3-2]|uniref:TonB-dependent receptor n=1 Tax=Roseisolibacter sp. H3M3-2 TaxID=3031323 RepID=UPI0023DCA885|nr:TonB-dependent receptor [Roseisolibacter sp. H3M3-2]MDF1505949.1 TonB-dependent receptor [Roseisolibacter sp. H3M3-2]